MVALRSLNHAQHQRQFYVVISRPVFPVLTAIAKVLPSDVFNGRMGSSSSVGFASFAFLSSHGTIIAALINLNFTEQAWRLPTV